MSRFSSREELRADAENARTRLDTLLAAMPDDAKLAEVTDGMTTKDFIAHRTEWGRMALSWYAQAKAGGSPAVPAEGYSWGQLNDLNAEIHGRFAGVPLGTAEQEFTTVSNELARVIEQCSDAELFTKRFYDFTGSSDLATYFTSATGGNYRSAYKHINRWWRANKAAYDGSGS